MIRGAGEVETGSQAQLRLRGGEERVAVAEGDRPGHAGQREVEEVGDRRDRRPDEPPVRSTTCGAAAAGSPPVIARMAVPEASASRQPRPAAGTEPAVRLDHEVADVTGVALGAVHQPAVAHEPAADAGGHHHRDEVALADRGADPAPRRARGPSRRCPPTSAARCAASEAPRSGKARQTGMLRGHEPPPASIGPPHPTPHTTGGAGGRLDHPIDQPGQPGEEVLGTPCHPVGPLARVTTPPASSTMPTASFVPPMSTASAIHRFGSYGCGVARRSSAKGESRIGEAGPSSERQRAPEVERTREGLRMSRHAAYLTISFRLR